MPPAKTAPISDHLAKVTDRHSKFASAADEAKQSNSQLHNALSEHLKAVRTLLLPLEEIEDSLPNANDLVTGKRHLSSYDIDLSPIFGFDPHRAFLKPRWI